jgi:hypothetical protein
VIGTLVERQDNSTLSPYRLLWAHVLKEAILTYKKKPVAGQKSGGKTSKKNASDAARFWFTLDDDGIGSFRWICWHLGLDPTAIKERIL